MEDMDVFASLTTTNMFDEELDKLIEPLSTKVVYPPKHVFLSPGEQMDHVYYIKKGRTKHYMGNADGSTKILYVLTPGWLFGETPAFLETNTGLYSRTEEETVICKIPIETSDRLIAESALFRSKFIKCYALKMLILRYEIENLTFNSCKNRLKRLFASSVDTRNISDPGWYNLKVRYTHSELGEIIGVARVTVSRQLNELCGDGFLRLINRRAQVNIEKYHEYINQNKIDDWNAY